MSEKLSKEEVQELNNALTGDNGLQLAIDSGHVKTLDDVLQAVSMRSEAIENQLAAAGVITQQSNRRWRLVFDKRRHWQLLRRD
ncbi:hypothetical protein [Undibacterium sp. TS12]|uniref:hypothetical protein n=1 Tax=Undibacterium sp. TS12 TaxID=2908202 RepID=UPI001F4CB9FB|nr:hypothetical protein [Undibacterium sp. TS12]MCH8622927.1 hypothetical protein [Undibacterium sp. TS12]